jgi:hypothetical protein
MVPTCAMTMAEYGVLKDAVLRYPTNPNDIAELLQSYDPASVCYLSPAPRWLKLHAPACCVTPDPQDFLLEVIGPLDDSDKVMQLMTHLGKGGVSVLVGCETGYSLKDFVEESTQSVVRLGLFDVGMGVQCLLDADGNPLEPKLTAGKGLHTLLHLTKEQSYQGAIKLRGFPTECLPGAVTCEMTNPAAAASLQTGFGPLLSAIDRVDILRKTLVTPSYPGFMSFAVSSCLATSADVGSMLDTTCHMQMSDAVNFCTYTKGENPKWTTYLPRALDSLACSSTGLSFAFGVGPAEEVLEPGVDLQLPHHVFEQAAGTAVLIPVGSVHKVSHPSYGTSLKLARDFQSPQSLAMYLRRDQCRVALLRNMLGGKAYISRQDNSMFAHPYVDNSLSRNVVVGSCFIALLSTALNGQ